IRLCVTECIAQRFTRDAVDVVADDWMQVTRRPLDGYTEHRRALLASTVVQLFGQPRDRLRQLVVHDGGRSQILNRVTPFGDRLIRPVERDVECVDRLRGLRGQEIARALKLKHQPLETLQQRVMQLPRDPRPLVDTFIETYIEGVCDLPKAKL